MTSLLLACALLVFSGAEAYQRGYDSGCRPLYVYGICELQPDPRAPFRVEGTVDMRQTIACSGYSQTEFRVQVSGLPTSYQYVERGFHVHEFADFSNGCTSAGAHYNPTKMVHGAPGDFIRHVGDLGNLETKPDGTIDSSITDAQANLLGQYPIVGRSIVLHEKRDDLGMGGDEESLKTGNAGGRLACCKIKIVHGSRWH